MSERVFLCNAHIMYIFESFNENTTLGIISNDGFKHKLSANNDAVKDFFMLHPQKLEMYNLLFKVLYTVFL